MANADEFISSSELLEECLKRADVEFFPKLDKRVGQFVDIFNHDLIQEKLIHFINGYTNLLKPIRESRTVFAILKNVRELISYVNEFDLLSTLQSTLSTGFDSLLNKEELNFFDDDTLDLDTKARKFLDLIQNERRESLDTANENQDHQTAFDEYLQLWQQNQMRMYPNQVARIKSDVKEMKEEYKKARLENWTVAELIVTDIRRIFAPLEEKLVGARFVYYGTLGLSSTIPEGRYLARGEPNWFKNTEKYLSDYVCGKISDDELRRFLGKERLEEDYELFNSHVVKWLNIIELRKTNQIQKRSDNGLFNNILLNLSVYIFRDLPTLNAIRFQSDIDTNTENLPSSHGLRIPKESVLIELERLRKFMYAVVLNKPAQLREHHEQMEAVIQQATRARDTTNNGAWMPCISFGQLSIPGRNERIVAFAFLLDPSIQLESDADEILSKLANFFDNIRSKKVEHVERQSSVFFQLHLEIVISDNIPQLIARIIKNLADLSIRGVLVGDFGLGGFRHAMNPTFNRIYSVNARDIADYFMSTWFSGARMRGEEPYYCPVGWRRFSIDVGKDGRQFENDYRNWPCAYHGSEGHRAMSILLKGLQACGTIGKCYLKSNKGAVYLSPSIEYCGHPRYARVWKVKSKYVQMVLQVRIDPKLLFDKCPGTLPGANRNTKKRIDPNFSNNELEWVIHWPPKTMISKLNGILVYGIMLRVTDQHPGHLNQNKWWEESHKENYWDYF